MAYFPQLSTGATGQFPVRRRRVGRTVLNESCQGYEVKLADSAAGLLEWHLSFEEISDQELAALEALFQAVEGRLMAFTFLDPVDNLLAWSEQQNEAVWQADPLLGVVGGVVDCFGGNSAFRITNPSAATLLLQQTIEAPASLEYCLSVYARSDSATRIWLVRGSDTEARPISPAWTRVVSAGQLTSSADSINFGIALDPQSMVEIFGIQTEAQAGASLYKKTTETGGVYPNARFRDDVLTIKTMGPGRHSCELDIVNVEHL